MINTFGDDLDLECDMLLQHQVKVDLQASEVWETFHEEVSLSVRQS